MQKDTVEKVFGVFISSPFNSQLFTNCCSTAILEDEIRCPKCRSLIIGHDAPRNSDRRLIRMQNQSKRFL